MISATLGVVAAAAIAGLATDFDLLTDSREIVAQGSATDITGSDFSSDDLLPTFPFLQWSENASGLGQVKFGSGSASSSQTSVMTRQALDATGTAFATALSTGDAFALGFAYSRYEVTFGLQKETRVRLTAQLTAARPANSSVILEKIGGDRIVGLDAMRGNINYDDDMTLDAGQYRFELRCDATVFFKFFEGTDALESFYSGSLSIVGPCNAADLAQPFGVLDLNDIAAFNTAFTSGDLSVDLAEEFGVLDLRDIGAFITAFQNGCP